MDLQQYLPLSGRPRVDESAVTPNWARLVGTTVLSIADSLATAAPDTLSLPSARAGWTIGEVLGDLEWMLVALARERRAAAVRSLLPGARERASLDRARAVISDGSTVATVSDRLRSLAAAELAPSARRSIGDLRVSVVAGFELALATGAELPIDPVASGATAIALATRAPVGIRAVLAERELVASDSDWRVGRGSPITGSAASIVLFLSGRRGVPADSSVD